MLLLALLALAEISARKLFPEPLFFTSKLRGFSEQAHTIEILFTGNSQMEQGLDCNMVGKGCFNAAVRSQDMFYTTQAIYKNLPKMKNLRAVFLNLSNFSLGMQSVLDSRKVAAGYYSEYGIAPSSDPILNPLLNSSTLILNRRSFLNSLFSGNTLHEDEKLNNHTKGMRAMRAFRASSHAALFGKINPHNVAILEELAKELKKRDILFYLVALPMHREYHDAYPKIVEKEFDAVIVQFVQKFSEVKFIDLRRNEFFDDKDFAFDGFHVSGNGRYKTSTIFRDSIRAAAEKFKR